MKIKWEENAWQEYVDWQQINKANISKINRLIKDRANCKIAIKLDLILATGK